MSYSMLASRRFDSSVTTINMSEAISQNTGLHDVWNLVWKLDLFLHGHGNQQLLDSYTAERIPIIKSVIETTDFLTKVLGTPNRFAQALRDAVIPMVSRLAPFQHAFVRRLSELGIAYQGSPILEGPGERYFDDSMRGGTGIAGRFLLLVNEKSPAGIPARRLCESFPDILELRSSGIAGIRLVRPDGYLAYSAGNGHSTDVQSVRSLPERQTNSAAAVEGRR